MVKAPWAFVLCSGLAITLLGCVPADVERSFALPSCANLRVQGNVHLTLKPLDRQSDETGSLLVSGTPDAVGALTVTHTAQLVSVENAHSVAVDVVAHCADLNRLELLGAVNAEQDGQGTLGAEIERLAVYGESKLALESVQSERLDVRVSGHGHLTVDGIVADAMQVLASSTSRLELQGEASRVDIDALGHAQVDAQALRSQWVEVRAGGDSEISIHASAHLGGQLSDASELRYSGSPDLSVDRVGSAHLGRL